MNRGRAETHLRQLAEAELRRAAAPGARGRGHASRLPLVAQALVAAGAVDVGTADQIRAELDLALAARYQAAGATPQQLARLTGVRPPGPSPRRSPRPGRHHGGWCRPAR
jgi:hypothetical protein